MPGLDDDDARGDPGDDDAPTGPRPDPSERPWVHPAELHAFVAAPASAADPPRPREWVIGVLSALAGVAATVLLLVAFGALGDRNRSAIPPPVVTTPDSPIDYAIARRVADSAALSIVTVNTNQLPDSTGAGAQGSGVIIRADLVLTSAHLFEGATAVKVSTKYGKTIDAQVLGTDVGTDLCLLAVEGVEPELPEPELTRRPLLGDPVVAIGAGRGNAGWVSMGVIEDHNVVASNGTVAVVGLLATSIGTIPTTSGGALFDENGRIIGILTTAPGATRIGLAIPIDVALNVAEQVERTKAASHGAAGILYAADSTDGPGGAVISGVVPGGPADKANPRLEPGDVLTRAGDADINGMADLLAETRRRRPDDRLEVTFQRAGRSQRTELVLGVAEPGIDTLYGPMG